MASSGKRKTTGAKLAREGRLRERRAAKKAKKDARRLAPQDHSVIGVAYPTFEEGDEAPEQELEPEAGTADQPVQEGAETL